MNNKIKIVFFLLISLMLFQGCGKSDDTKVKNLFGKTDFKSEIVPLGAIGGGKYYYTILDINAEQQIAGTFKTTEAFKFNKDGGISGVSFKYPFHAFVWSKDSGIVKFNQYGENSIPFDINDNGFVVGRIIHDKKKVPFVWEKEMGIIYLDSIPEEQKKGYFAEHDIIGGSAYAVNNLNQVVGFVEMDELIYDHYKNVKQDYRTNINMKYAFIWDKKNGMRIIDPDNLPNACALDINDEGKIAGYFDKLRGNNRYRHCFVWDEENGVKDIGIIQTNYFTTDFHKIYINNNNQVVIHMEGDMNPQNMRIYRWNETDGLTLINTLSWSILNKLNEQDKILGRGMWGMFVLDMKSNKAYVSTETILPKKYSTSLQEAITESGYFVGLENNATENCSIFLVKPDFK